VAYALADADGSRNANVGRFAKVGSKIRASRLANESMNAPFTKRGETGTGRARIADRLPLPIRSRTRGWGVGPRGGLLRVGVRMILLFSVFADQQKKDQKSCTQGGGEVRAIFEAAHAP
jgi:hypothetical protein